MKTDPNMPECDEGPKAASNFNMVMSKLLSVSHEELMRREAEYRKQSLSNPNRRGPKPKVKSRRRRTA